jgi:hypothetical protein
MLNIMMKPIKVNNKLKGMIHIVNTCFLLVYLALSSPLTLSEYAKKSPKVMITRTITKRKATKRKCTSSISGNGDSAVQ